MLTNTEQRVLQVLRQRPSMSPTSIAAEGLLEPREVDTSVEDLLEKGLLRRHRKGFLLVEPLYTLTDTGRDVSGTLPEWERDIFEYWRWGRILATRGIESYLFVGALVAAAGMVILQLDTPPGLGISLLLIGFLVCTLGVAAKS